MTDVKLAQVNAPTGKNSIADCGVNLWLDWTSRAAVVVIYGGFALISVASVPRLLPLDSVHKLLMIAASIANVLFLGLVALTTITRLVPIQKSKGIETRISALLGTFLSIALAFLPKAELGPIWSTLSTTLILVGTSLSFGVLRWLGKSFSILAEARRLVTEGPYRIVRHPLYICEGVALVGVTLQVLSPLAVLIAIAVVMAQWRRMINEEAILILAFPEYRAYAANTSFLIPTKFNQLELIRMDGALRALAHHAASAISPLQALGNDFCYAGWRAISAVNSRIVMKFVRIYEMRRLLLFAVALLLCQPAWAGNRVALVIGNSTYKNAALLLNPVNDAAIVAATLKNAGFDVVETRLDLQVADMRRTLRDFADQVRDADVAVVYYAGHGVELEGTNYLIPTDATLERDTDVYDEAFSLDRVLLAIEPARQLRLVIVDACRNNPFAEKMKRTVGSRAISRGLARIEPATSNTLVAFAAKAGSTASDGNSKNSPYATALVKYIATPGLDLRRVFGFVRDDVMKATGNRQEPYVYGTLGGDDVPLVAKETASSASPRADMRYDYELALQVGNKDALNFFLAQYPDGYYANLAKLQLAKIAAEEMRVAATEKARLAQQEQVRLANEGAQQMQLAKAASDLKAAEEARIAAEKAKEAAQEQAAQAEQRRVTTDNAAAVKNVVSVAPDTPQETKVDTRIAALPSPQVPAQPPQAELAKSVQTELRRVGCFTGSANGEWDAASRRALELFNQHAGTKFEVKLASADALDAIKLKPARVCPLICAFGFKRDGDRCSKITCAAGSFVNDDNECEKRKVRQVPSAWHDRREAPAKPKAEASAGDIRQAPSARHDRREAPAKPKAEASADVKSQGGMPFIPFFLP